MPVRSGDLAVSERRRIRALADGALLRTATFEGREHLVVPVVALIGDAVIRPLHSEVPELVPATLLALAPAQWDGRPVVAEHPDGGLGSANEPETLETARFGIVFATRFEDQRLRLDAWLDATRAEAIGGAAAEAVATVRRGEQAEVSVGAWVTLVAETGRSPTGVAYGARWTTIAADHLAFGLAGAAGACSIEMGCGAPRAAQRSGEEAGMSTSAAGRQRGMLRRLIDRLTSAQSEDAVSDNALRDALWAALRADEPAFEGVVEVFASEGLVIYATSPEGAIQLWRRGFTLDAGSVTLADEKELVEAVTKFEPAAAASCGSGCRCNHEENETMDNETKTLVASLIAASRGRYEAGDAEALAGFGVPRLTAMLAAVQEAEEVVVDDEDDDATAPKPDVVPDPVEDGSVTLPAAEVEALRKLAAERRAEQAKERESLVAAVAAVTDVWTKAELAAMSVDDLRRLAKALPRPRDYSGRGVPLESTDAAAPPPPDVFVFSRAVREGKSRADAMKAARGAN